MTYAPQISSKPGTQPRPQASGAAQRPMRVLLVEDNAADAEATRELLARADDAGIQLHCAANLEQGLPLLQSGSIDVLLLDLTLPESRGLDAFHLASSSVPGVPIIALTSNNCIELACQAVREGAQDYLIKGEIDGRLLVRAMRYAYERKQVEEALRQERDFAESLIEAAQTIVLLIDMDGRLVRMNNYFFRVSGYSADETWGHDWLTAFIPEDARSRLQEAMQQMLAGRAVRGILAPLTTHNGHRRDIQWYGRRITDPKHQVIGVLLIGHDVTELREAQERALRSERLAAIGQMVTGLAHESRNALQRSQACLERLALRVRDQSDAMDLIERIQRAQDDLQYLYDEVRAYAAPIRLSCRPGNLGEFFKQCWNEATQLCQREHRVRHHWYTTDLQAEFDPRALAQVFRNVLHNAIDACPDMVEIAVEWRDCQLQGRPAVRIQICDNGPGLSADVQERIFEPFFTSKTHGTGLGMPIAKRIVEAHAGQITAGSSRHGARITIILPRRVS